MIISKIGQNFDINYYFKHKTMCLGIIAQNLKINDNILHFCINCENIF